MRKRGLGKRRALPLPTRGTEERLGQSAVAGRRGAAGKTEPMHLADDGIARDAAELLRDLRGAETRAPELVKGCNAIIGPGHEYLQK
jgi:hypothetical protein